MKEIIKELEKIQMQAMALERLASLLVQVNEELLKCEGISGSYYLSTKEGKELDNLIVWYKNRTP